MRKRAEQSRKGEPRILYIQYTNPAAYPPLEHSSRILAKLDWRVLFLGTAAQGANALRFPPDGNIEVRQMSFSPAGWRQKFHYLRFILWIIWWTWRWRPQWIYASDPFACLPVLLLTFISQSHVIYHEHDSPSSSSKGFFYRLSLSARRRLAYRARLCILPNRQRLEQFIEEVSKPMKSLQPASAVIWNCPSLDEVPEPRAMHSGDFWVLYHGSIVPSRLPETVLRALALLPGNVKLRVIGYETIGHSGYVRRLQQIAAELGLANRIEFLGAIPERKNLLRWTQKSDVGLAFMPKATDDINQQAMTGASNKPFDYLACGLALLVSDLPDWKAMYVEPGYGFACDPENVESLAASMRQYLDNPEVMRHMGESGRQRIIKEWNYETQFAPVLKYLTDKP